MPSLAKTFRRWYWTVRAAEEQPTADLGVRQSVPGQSGHLGLLRGQLVRCRSTGVRLRAVSPVACNSRLARVCEGLHAHRLEHVVGECGVAPAHRCGDAPVATTRRRGGAREPGPPSAGAAELLDRLEIESLRGLAVAEQRVRACLQSHDPVGATGRGHLEHPVDARRRRCPASRCAPPPRRARPGSTPTRPDRRGKRERVLLRPSPRRSRPPPLLSTRVGPLDGRDGIALTPARRIVEGGLGSARRPRRTCRGTRPAQAAVGRHAASASPR